MNRKEFERLARGSRVRVKLWLIGRHSRNFDSRIAPRLRASRSAECIGRVVATSERGGVLVESYRGQDWRPYQALDVLRAGEEW